MKVIRSRITVAIASSAVMAGGFGLTAVALGSTGPAATSAIASSQPSLSPCPQVTLIEYCSSK